MPDEIVVANVQSEEVQDIIGQAPRWIIARGNMVILLLTILLFAGAWFIRFPDVISAPVKISSFAPPIKLVAQSNGRIVELYARDNDLVEEGQLIAIIDNSSNTANMLSLRKSVDALDTTLDEHLAYTLAKYPLPGNMQVGDLQGDYSALCQAIINYNFFNKSSYYTGAVKYILRQKNAVGAFGKNIEDKSGLLNDQLKIERWKDSVNKVLLNEHVISQAEYNEAKKNYLSQGLNSSSNQATLLQNRLQMDEYQKSLNDLHQQHNVELKNTVLSIKDAAKKLKGQIASWERLYVLRSPVKGRLTFFQVRKENQYVNAGAPVFMVVPNLEQYEIRAEVPIYKAGKIKIGERALIKLQQYPFEEFGMLQARVASITNVALDSNYVVGFLLVDGLKTTRKRNIDNIPEIFGTADIITKDKTILQRLFEGLYGQMHKE